MHPRKTNRFAEILKFLRVRNLPAENPKEETLHSGGVCIVYAMPYVAKSWDSNVNELEFE